MAQEQKRDQTVRLPNPSAQPFVAALKTARFFAVLFFWVTMVCVLAHAATFFLMEWFGLYDMPAAEARAAPEPIDETVRGPAARRSEPPVQTWFSLFESAALAADPGELFPGVEPALKSSKPASSKPAAEKPAVEETSPPQPPVTEGMSVADPGESAGKPAPPAPEQRRRTALYYRNLTAGLLPPARIIGVLSAILLTVTVFIYLQIALLGRLAGIRQLTRALFVLLLFLWTVFPWESIFEGFRTSALFGFDMLLEAHTARLGAATQDWVAQLAYFGQYLVMPVAAVLLLAWSGIQFAGGYNRSVLANE